MGLKPGNPIGQAPSARQLLWQGNQVILNGSSVYSPDLDVSQYNYLTFLFDTTLGSNAYYAITPIWSYGYGDTSSILQDGMTIGPGTTNVVTVPAFAPGLTVEIAQSTSLNEPAIVWAVYGRLQALLGDLTNPYGEPLISQNYSIGSGVTYTLYTAITYFGRAIVDIANTGTTNWNAYIDYYDTPSNSWVNIMALNTETNVKGQIATVALPPSPCRIRTINRDTSAHSFTISMTAFR